MNQTSFLLSLALLIVNLRGLYVVLQQEPQDQITGILIQLQNESWAVREQAVRRLQTLPDKLKDDRVKTALVELLEKENTFLKGHVPGKLEGYREAYSEYYSQLLGIVLELKDKRAIRALVNSAYNPYSALAHSIAGYGEEALDSVLEGTQQQFEPPEKQSVISVLNVMIENHLSRKATLNSESLVRIKRTLVGLVSTRHRSTRLEVVKGLGMLGAKELAPTIKAVLSESLQQRLPMQRLVALEVVEKFPPDMAAAVPLEEIKALSLTDAHTIIKDVQGQKQEVYPIREKAKQLVAKFGRVEKR